MLAETPLALRYILPDDVYVLRAEKDLLGASAASNYTTATPEEMPVVAEPEIMAQAPVTPPVVEPAPAIRSAEPAVAIPTPTETPVKIPALEQSAVSIPTIPVSTPPVTEKPIEQKPAAGPTPQVPLKYRGGYKKRLLILVYYPQHDLMEDTHIKALGATLNKLDLRSEDVAMMNLHRNPGATYAVITEQLNPAKLVILGDEAIPAGLEAPALNQITAMGGAAVLLSHSFGAMMGNKDYTRAFWEQIKAI